MNKPSKSKSITREMNQRFAKDAEAALDGVESDDLSLIEWSRLLERRSARLVKLQNVNAPAQVIEQEAILIEQALEGVQSKLL